MCQTSPVGLLRDEFIVINCYTKLRLAYFTLLYFTRHSGRSPQCDIKRPLLHKPIPLRGRLASQVAVTAESADDCWTRSIPMTSPDRFLTQRQQHGRVPSTETTGLVIRDGTKHLRKRPSFTTERTRQSRICASCERPLTKAHTLSRGSMLK